jgi:hypothetical protein
MDFLMYIYTITMSIPSGVKPADLAKYRETYMSNLRLKAANIQKSADAIKILDETGEVVKMRDDTRTASEKRGDILTIKVDVLGDLYQITSPDEAERIVAELDDTELTFLNDAMKLIVPDIQIKYRKGVPAPIFVAYLRQMIKNAERTLGVRYGLQGGRTENALLTDKNIVGTLVNFEALDRLEDAVSAAVDSPMRTNVLEYISVLRRQIPTREELKNLRDFPSQKDIRALLSKMLDNVPSNKDILRLTEELEGAVSRRDLMDTDNLLLKIGEKIKLPESDIAEREALVMLVEKELGGGNFNRPLPEAEAEFVGGESALFTPDSFGGLKASKQREVLEKLRVAGDIKMGQTLLKRASSASMSAIYRDWYERQPQSLPTSVARVVEDTDTIKGTGIALRPVRKYDMGKYGFHKFGTKYIRKDDLRNGKLCIRQPSNQSVIGLPVQRISKKLSNILTSILEHGKPEYSDLEELSEEDKLLLSRISSTTKLGSKLSLPTPNKSKNEKEEHRFQVLKGQILAGNDSPQIVKELKTLLMKFMNDRRLCKTEVLSILETLVSMGY